MIDAKKEDFPPSEPEELDDNESLNQESYAHVSTVGNHQEVESSPSIVHEVEVQSTEDDGGSDNSETPVMLYVWSGKML